MFPGLFSGIPHLKAGFAYSFGKRVRQGRGIVDYLLPLDIAPATTLFGEFHGEFQDFWKRPCSRVVLAPAVGVSGLQDVPIPSLQRYDLSVGGGLRRGIRADTILGINAFFDTSKVYDRWYSSGGLGLEFLSLLPGDGLLDLNFNYYGNLFSLTDFVTAFRYGTGNFDIEAGYSQPLFNEAVDLRLKAVGYQFDVGRKVYGWRTGVDATTRDGMFRVSYEYTSDRINAPYHTISGSMHLGFQLENLLRGESPFTRPDPIFASPRNIARIFNEPVKRNWTQPTQIVQRRGIPPIPPPPPPPTLRIILMGIEDLGGVNAFIYNIDVANATFDVITDPFAPNAFDNFSYSFRVSDDSIQDVTGTVATISTCGPNYLDANFWNPGGPSVGPNRMDGPIASTQATFGCMHTMDFWPVVCEGGESAIATITISVPSRPDIAPLVITAKCHNVAL